MKHLNIIKATLESDVTPLELPIVEKAEEHAIQMAVVDQLDMNNKEINMNEYSVEKMSASLEQLSFYRQLLTTKEKGIALESFNLIGYGLQQSLRNIGLSMTDGGLGLEAFTPSEFIVGTVPDTREFKRDGDDIKELLNETGGATLEADDHTDEDINAGIDGGDAGTGVSDGGEGEAEGDPAATDDNVGEEEPAADPTLDDAAAVDDGAGEPHQSIEEPEALQADNDPSPTINMVMRDGEVQISIESIDHLAGRIQHSLESFVHEIFRGIYEAYKKLVQGYESVGRDAQRLVADAEELITRAKESNGEIPWGFAHPDRLAYKGKLTVESILEGQEALRKTFDLLVNKLPKLNAIIVEKANKAIGMLKETPEENEKRAMADMQLAKDIYRDYKQMLVDVYPKDLPGGFQVEYGDWHFGWSELKHYGASESLAPIDVKSLDKLPQLLTNVIAMSKLFSARKSILENIDKQQKINVAAMKNEARSEVADIIKTIEKEYAKNIVQYFEMVFKHCLSVNSFVASLANHEFGEV